MIKLWKNYSLILTLKNLFETKLLCVPSFSLRLFYFLFAIIFHKIPRCFIQRKLIQPTVWGDLFDFGF